MLLRFIDTHCHLNAPVFLDELDLALQMAQQAGIQRLMVPAVSANDFSQLLSLKSRYAMLDIALGLHPIAIGQHSETSLQQLENCLNEARSKISALGEIGLDNFMPDAEPNKQIHFLIQQLHLAAQFELPVILHSRRSHDQLHQLLKQHKVARSGVVHGFAGSLQQAQQFVKLGYYIGVGGTITYARARKTRETIAKLPLEALVLETDSPDMPIQGRQGTLNRPEYIVEIFKALCEIRQESATILMQQLFQNSLNLYQTQ